LDIGVLGYIGIVWPKEHSPEVWSVPPVTPCINLIKTVTANSEVSFSSSQSTIYSLVNKFQTAGFKPKNQGHTQNVHSEETLHVSGVHSDHAHGKSFGCIS